MIRSSMSSIPAGEWKRIFGYPKPPLSMKVFYRELARASSEYARKGAFPNAVYLRTEIPKQGHPRTIRVVMKKELK